METKLCSRASPHAEHYWGHTSPADLRLRCVNSCPGVEPRPAFGLAFRIKSGTTFEDHRYTPVFESISHLQDHQWFDHLRFIKGSPGPYILEISHDGWHTWEEIGELNG